MQMNNQSSEATATMSSSTTSSGAPSSLLIKNNNVNVNHLSSSSTTTTNADIAEPLTIDYTALITPTKAIAEARLLEKNEKKRQQVNVGPHAPSSTAAPTTTTALGSSNSSNVAVSKKQHKKKRSTSEGESTANTKSLSQSQSIKWPPVSSSKSLPPLSGRVSDLLRAEMSNSRGSLRDTIEFEVNQECKLCDK